MIDCFLDAPYAQMLRHEAGVTTEWLNQHLGLSRTSGYLLFRTGLLPTDPERRREVLRKLSDLFGVPEAQLVIRISRPSSKASKSSRPKKTA
jgi:hypothetical protein